MAAKGLKEGRLLKEKMSAMDELKVWVFCISGDRKMCVQ
jgi:hypothetical protein